MPGQRRAAPADHPPTIGQVLNALVSWIGANGVFSGLT
jgi:hypothetical protein